MILRASASICALVWGLLGCDRTPASGVAEPPSASDRSGVAQEHAAPGAADAPPSEPPRPPTTEETALELVAAMEALAELHDERGADCASLASALEAFAGERRELLARQSPAVHAWIDANDAARARLRVAMGTVMTGSMRCRDDAAVKAVYAKLRAQ